MLEKITLAMDSLYKCITKGKVKPSTVSVQIEPIVNDLTNHTPIKEFGDTFDDSIIPKVPEELTLPLVGEELESIETEDGLPPNEPLENEAPSTLEACAAQETIVIEPKPVIEIPHPLLNNAELVKLMEECVDIMQEFGAYMERLESAETREIITLFTHRISESLVRCGATRIENEETFNILRHTPVPMQIVAEGTPIASTLVAGIALENRVILKANVTIKES